ncbi:MAG: hypothetical protein FWD49_04690 [Firmicutes bacterium]|nr:hypothetical protein [Bacillota bacterium]
MTNHEQEKQKLKEENTETCRHIAEKLQQYVDRELRVCPECGQTFVYDDNADQLVTLCPLCHAEIDVEDLETPSLHSYFSDHLGETFRINGNRDYESVRVMITCGGPNIYVDTESKCVQLYWGGDEAHYSLSNKVVAEINEIFEEIWNNH